MIAPALLEDIYAHARAEFPAECCGYLVGPRDQPVDTVVRCRNAQPDGVHPTHPARGAETGFVIAGAELFAFARSLDGDRPARVVYHSHPNGRAYLSAIDRDLAYPDLQQLVVGITAAGITEAILFDASHTELARWAP